MALHWRVCTEFYEIHSESYPEGGLNSKRDSQSQGLYNLRVILNLRSLIL